MHEGEIESKSGGGKHRNVKKKTKEKKSTDETDARVLIIHLYSSKQHANSFSSVLSRKKKKKKKDRRRNIYNRRASVSKSVSWRSVRYLFAPRGEKKARKWTTWVKKKQEREFKYSELLIRLVVICSPNVFAWLTPFVCEGQIYQQQNTRSLCWQAELLYSLGGDVEAGKKQQFGGCW